MFYTPVKFSIHDTCHVSLIPEEITTLLWKGVLKNPGQCLHAHLASFEVNGFGQSTDGWVNPMVDAAKAFHSGGTAILGSEFNLIITSV